MRSWAFHGEGVTKVADGLHQGHERVDACEQSLPDKWHGQCESPALPARRAGRCSEGQRALGSGAPSGMRQPLEVMSEDVPHLTLF